MVKKGYSQFEMLDNELAHLPLRRAPLPEKRLVGFRQMLNLGGFNEIPGRQRDRADHPTPKRGETAFI